MVLKEGATPQFEELKKGYTGLSKNIYSSLTQQKSEATKFFKKEREHPSMTSYWRQMMAVRTYAIILELQMLKRK